MSYAWGLPYRQLMRDSTEADLLMHWEFLEILGHPEQQGHYLAQLTAEARRHFARSANEPKAEHFLRTSRPAAEGGGLHPELTEYEYRQKVKAGEIDGPPVRRATAADRAMLDKQRHLIRAHGVQEGARRWALVREAEEAARDEFLRRLAEEGR